MIKGSPELAGYSFIIIILYYYYIYGNRDFKNRLMLAYASQLGSARVMQWEEEELA